MKTIRISLVMLTTAILLFACSNVSYDKTPSGLLYKIIPGGSKDSLPKGAWLKIFFKQTLGDSVLMDNYGKMPIYVQNIVEPNSPYNPGEIFDRLKKGDSAVTVMFVDSLLSKKLMQQLPPFMKKGQKITTYFKVAEVFTNDSLYMVDEAAEKERDRPRAMKEQEEQMDKMIAEMLEKRKEEETAVEKSGEAAAQMKALAEHLQSKNITVQQVGKGTYVHIETPGDKAQASAGKYVTIRYEGKRVENDSTFDSGILPFKVAQGRMISGLEEGIQVFKEGGKGTIYVAGYKAYGKEPGQGSPFKPNDALKFNVEVLTVSDTMAAPPPMPNRPQPR